MSAPASSYRQVHDLPLTRTPATGPIDETIERTGGGTVKSVVSTKVVYQPIVDVARGVAAGYQAQTHPGVMVANGPQLAPQLLDDETGELTASVAHQALAAAATLPPNTFLSLPIRAQVAASEPVRTVLTGHGDLTGIVLDIVSFSDRAVDDALIGALAEYRGAGALIAVGGHGASQPELTSIVKLKPAIIRLGRDWVRGIDQSEAKRSAVEMIGQLAGQLDAWILSEGVDSAAELRVLASLGVPLAQGPFIGRAQQVWPEVDTGARTALPKIAPESSDGILRGLLQQAYTATDLSAAAAVLPETSGFDAVVVIDEDRRPISLLEHDGEAWEVSEALAVNIDTDLADAVARAMMRPRTSRFTPLVCTDDTGRFLGILRIERLMAHLAGTGTGTDSGRLPIAERGQGEPVSTRST